MTWVDTWPQQLQPLDDDGAPDGELVEGYQLRPGELDAFLAWSGGEQLLINGGPAVLLPGTVRSISRLVGLGDFAIRHGNHMHAVAAAGFWQRYALPADDEPADPVDEPPADGAA